LHCLGNKTKKYFLKILKQLLALLLIILTWLPGKSQSDYSDAELLAIRSQSVISNYQGYKVADILNGKDYTIKHLHAINSQLFMGLSPSRGTLVYDGVLLHDIEMQYDLFNQEFVILLESDRISRYVSIDQQKISNFSFAGFNFIYIENDNALEDGIYQVAFKGGKSTLFIKRSKNMTSTAKSDALIRYIPVNKYFVKNNNGTFSISSKKSLLSAFNDSEELKSILKIHKIKFSQKKIEQGLITAITLYDSSNNE